MNLPSEYIAIYLGFFYHLFSSAPVLYLHSNIVWLQGRKKYGLNELSDRKFCVTLLIPIPHNYTRRQFYAISRYWLNPTLPVRCWLQYH